jgi:predicted nucleotidyltransferase
MDAQQLSEWSELAIQRLQNNLDPEQIILFGSWARGTATRHSDIDLFILLDTDQSPLERIGRVLNILWDAPRPLEVIVYTPAELACRRDLPFLRQLLQEGKVLYEQRKAEN